MPDDPLIPAPKKSRPPVAGWLFAVFGLGMVPVGAFICALTLPSHPREMGGAILLGGLGGLILGLPMLGGLAIAVHFFDDSPMRFLFGILFSVAIIAVLAGGVFAGCMCVLQGPFR
jgi:hypothetical protein